MKFVVDFPVNEFKAPSREEVLSHITNKCTYGYVSRPGGVVSGNRVYHGDKEYWRFYILQKFNKKSQQVQTIDENGKNVSTSKVLRKPYWVGRYIDVPHEFIKEGMQCVRNFHLSLRSK